MIRAGQVIGGLDWIGWRWLTAIALSCFLPRSEATIVIVLSCVVKTLVRSA